jgi:isoquinoline 1-oxidoreductase beta subunit
MNTHPSTISRRKFLQTGALLSSGLLISFTIPQAGKLARIAGGAPADPFVPNAYLHIAPDNVMTVMLSHVEMGQGIWTTLPMLLADELDADLKSIRVMHGSVEKAFNHTVHGIMITGGSTTTWSEFDRYRKAGAAARIMLTQAAASRVGIALENCKTENGYVIAGNQKFSYGELAAEAAKLPVPADIPLRPAAEWKYIGKGAKRLDAPEKTNGTARFGMDVQFPGLLTAVVAHSPVFGGKVRSYDASNALKVPGVHQVIEIPTGVAVIADHYWAATQGRKVLQVTWDEGPGAQLNSREQAARYRQLAQSDGIPAQKKGDATAALAKASKAITAEYVFPYLAHAPMEPLNVTVKLGATMSEIWTGTQLPTIDQVTAAQILGLKPEQVKINIPFLGGGFGRRASPASDFVAEAAYIAKASNTRFIKMVRSREDDLKAGYYRPFYVHKVQVALGPDAMPVAWHHNIVGQSILAGTPFSVTIKNGIDDTSVEGVIGSPYLSSIPDHFVGLTTTSEVVPVLWFRSVGNSHTAFVMETMIDQLAHEAGIDPVNYRRRFFKEHMRHLGVLDLVAEKGNWAAAPPAGRYKGVAVHEAFGSFVAMIAEVSVQNEKVRVHKVDCAIDCGLVVNPDGVRAQMESGIIFGLTMALYGELALQNGRLQQSNFYDYRMVRMNESPEINVYVMNSSEKLGGVGECGVPTVAPAIANAVFAATGRRIYDLPFMNIPLKTRV